MLCPGWIETLAQPFAVQNVIEYLMGCLKSRENAGLRLDTPVPAGVAIPLLEGLKNEVVCRENQIRDLIPTRLIPMEEAICTASLKAAGGPGKLPSVQAYFLRLSFQRLTLLIHHFSISTMRWATTPTAKTLPHESQPMGALRKKWFMNGT